MNELINTKTLLFSSGFLLLVISVFFHVYKKEKLSIAFLLGSAVLFFLFACILDPFLNPWDERFHALVAKNLMHHPLMPTLYDDTVVNMRYDDNWDHYHIWLQKQPLFLWQIALSYKVFGVTEFALRFPSALLCCINVFAIYRSGKILGNSNVGYYAALLFTSSFYMIQLVSGYQELDQNDVSFVAYISLSIWAWLEYYQSKNKYWIILIGIFSGCALLCKMLVGLLVYLGWGVYSILENKLAIKKYRDIAASVIVTAIVFLPWQILILKWYPAEAIKSYQYNSTAHLFETVDGHEGPWYYHFEMMGKIFGLLATWFILPALVIFYIKLRDKKLFFSFLAMILAVYLLFSFAATKMPSFTAVLVFPVFLLLAFFMDFIFSNYEKIKMPAFVSKALLIISIVWLAFARIDIRTLNELHTIAGNENNYCRVVWEKNKKIFRNLKLPAKSLIFNVNGRNYIDAMFYTDFSCYEIIPSEDQYLDIKKKNRPIVLFRPLHDSIPSYLKNDPSVIILNDTINLCE